MRYRTGSLLLIFLLALPGCSTPLEADAELVSMTSDEITELVDRVIGWQLEAYPPEMRGKSWRDATLFIGITEIAITLENDSYWEQAREWAEQQKWEIGGRREHADDHAAGQVYLQFYEREQNEYMIRDFKHWIDKLIHVEISGDELWWWCDALFMAPPAIAHLASVSGGDEYQNFLNEKFWESKEHLYDTSHRLFYRDDNFFDKRNELGNPVFWSRGNGWVVAGLARIMNQLPRENSDYEKYRALFIEMMDRIVEIQPDDGLWRTDLLNPGLYPTPEVSGSAFFCYALGWGIQQQIFKDEKYISAFRKAWSGLVQKVDKDGKLGFAQEPGHQPGHVNEANSEIFATGAFLLAASEAYKVFPAVLNE